MPLPTFTYQDLPVCVVRHEDKGYYEFGVVVAGAFVVFCRSKLGGIDSAIESARLEAAQSQSASSSSASPPQG